MTRKLRLLPAGVEEAQFKRVPEGWLFSTANPWILAPRRTYLVSELQKPAIAARVRCSRYLMMVLLPTMAVLLATALVTNLSMSDFRSILTWLVFGAFVVVFAAAVAVIEYLAVRPLIRDLPRSKQKIGLIDMLRRQSEAMSVTALTISTLLFVMTGVANVYLTLTSAAGNPFSAIGGVAIALFGIAFAGMLIEKLRRR